MTKKEKMQYIGKNPVAVYGLTNTMSITIFDIVNGLNDFVVYAFTQIDKAVTIDDIKTAKINHGVKVSSFKTSAGYSVRLNDCIRV